MVRHFQKLFNLHALEAVYPTMTLLSQQVEQHRNVQRRLKSLMNLGVYFNTELIFLIFTSSDATCSIHKLISAIELVVLKESSEFMDKINKYFGPEMNFDK